MGGVFINIVLREYGCQMFGEIAADGSGFAELRQSYGGAGVGNHVTFNFNLIYRFHTAIPEEWSATATNPPPIESDEQLRKVFTDMLSWHSGGFGPSNVPQELLHERMRVSHRAIEAARLLGAPTLNQFRRRFTSPYKDFDDMCGDPEVAKVVASIYDDIEDVELVVGCQVERSMKGGWGLGDSIGLAIVADAFVSIRQDRFYTQDFNAGTYTDWGFAHAKTTVLADLLNRHLGMKIDRTIGLEKLPGYTPPTWEDFVRYDARGFPVLKKETVDAVGALRGAKVSPAADESSA